MKYLYKGMASVEEGGNCSVILNWHEKVRRLHPRSDSTGIRAISLIRCFCNVQLTEVAGVGCIVRTMADFRAV